MFTFINPSSYTGYSHKDKKRSIQYAGMMASGVEMNLIEQLEKEEIEKNNSSEGSDPTTWTCLETSPSVGGGVS